MPPPIRMLRPARDPEPDHADVRERERHEHVDRVHDDELRDRSAGRDHRAAAAATPIRSTPLRIVRRSESAEKPVREPRVGGHVRHDPRPVDESGLGGDEEQRGLADQRDDRRGRGRTRSPRASRSPRRARRGRRSWSCPLRAWRRRAGSRRGSRTAVMASEVAHHAPSSASRSATFGSRIMRHAVRDGLDAGVGAAAERVGAGEEVEHAPRCRASTSTSPRLCPTSPRPAAEVADVLDDHRDEHERVRQRGRARRSARSS